MASDIFAKIGDIKGESTDAKHKDEIEIESFSFGEAANTSETGQRSGKVQLQDFHFVMRVNKASPNLMKACATGQHIKEATITARKAGQTQLEYLKIKLEEVVISSYQHGGQQSEDVFFDQFSMWFTRIELEHVAQTAAGGPGESTFFKYDRIKGE